MFPEVGDIEEKTWTRDSRTCRSREKTRHVGNFMGASNIVCIESSNANHRRHCPPASPPKPPLTHACSTDFGLVSSRKFEVNTIIIKLYFVDVGHRICSDFQASFSIPINGSKTI